MFFVHTLLPKELDPFAHLRVQFWLGGAGCKVVPGEPFSKGDTGCGVLFQYARQHQPGAQAAKMRARGSARRLRRSSNVTRRHPARLRDPAPWLDCRQGCGRSRCNRRGLLLMPPKLLHTAFVTQLCVPSEHSSSSIHVVPSPVYPELQLQLKEPT